MTGELVRVAYLKPGDVIVVGGERLVVRAVEYTNKDAVCVRFRGRKPIYAKWDHEVERIP